MPSSTFELNPQSQFIRAGAGAGKTTKLISTFLDFVAEFKKEHQRFPRVVMTTFTRKATQEVKERLLVSALKQNQNDVFEYINKKSFVHISTIHGLLSLFLSQYADQIQFSQQITIVDGPQFDRTLKKQINEILKKKIEYLEILETYSFSDLVGISKRALDYKAQSSDMTYVSEIELQGLARKSRSEIVRTIDDIFSQSINPGKGWPEYFEYLSSIKNCISNKDDEALKKILDEAPSKPRWSEKSPSLNTEAHELVLKLTKQLLVDLFDSEAFILQHEKLNQLFNSYLNDLEQISSEHKRRTGELTISDLESLSLQLIQKSPDSVKEFSNSWDFFMIDEYQDTSPLQVEILNQIVRDRPCFIVGDPQQSIYLFRGARSEVFENKQKEMHSVGAKVDFLQTNYRSNPSLMCFINDFFTNFSTQFKAMIPKEQSQSSHSAHEVYYVKTQSQADGVVSHIQYLLNLGAKPQDICVLSRSNKNLEQVAQKSSEVGLHVQLQSAAGFEDKREILDLISFNRFLNNPHDDENLITLLRSPWFLIEDLELVELAQIRINQKISFWQLLTQKKHLIFLRLKNYLDQFDQSGVLQTTKLFISESGFLNFSHYYDPNGKREANIIKYLTTLATSEKVSGFSLGLFLDEQFQSIQIDSGAGNSEAQPVVQPDCVSLMTVHAAKGLQFKHVIVTGMSDIPPNTKTERLVFDSVSRKYSLSIYDEAEMKIIPSCWSEVLRQQLKSREAEESHRVLYVAMTRAIESITLVADESKKTNKNAWISQMTWPIEGEHVQPQYKTLSLTYTESPKVMPRKALHVQDVRSPFQVLKTENVTTSSLSVTELIDGNQSGKLAPDFERQLKNLKKAQYGTDLHRLFESLKYLNSEQLKKLINREDQKTIDYLFNLQELDMKLLLNTGYNEWGFGLKIKDRLIQGQIDLWAETESEFHVLDYKTGSSEYADKAFDQLSFYTLALISMKMINSGKKIIHSVIYPVEQKTIQKFYQDKTDFLKKTSIDIKKQFEIAETT